MSLVLEYIWVRDAWYARSTLEGRDFVDEVYLCVQQDSRLFELAIRWVDLRTSQNQRRDLDAYLHVFDESWGVFAALPDLAGVLARIGTTRGGPVTPEAVMYALRGMGFVDATPRRR